MARLSAKVSEGGRSQSSCCFCPITSVIDFRKAVSRRARHEAGHAHLAGAGVEEPGEDLQRGGLPRAVRAEEADPLAGPDREGDAVDGPHRLVAPPEEGADRRAQPGLAPVDLVLLAQLADLDHGRPR